jgi:hypothetical protein
MGLNQGVEKGMRRGLVKPLKGLLAVKGVKGESKTSVLTLLLQEIK